MVAGLLTLWEVLELWVGSAYHNSNSSCIVDCIQYIHVHTVYCGLTIRSFVGISEDICGLRYGISRELWGSQ